MKIVPVQGSLTDHYDPRTKTVSLSQDVYGQTSVASVCVAAHECGHAIQHAVNYAPLNIRSAIVPVANLGSSLFMADFPGRTDFFHAFPADAGDCPFFAGSSVPACDPACRVQCVLQGSQAVGKHRDFKHGRSQGARRVLTAAALTYVAALASSILQLLRLIILAGGRDRD